MIQKYRVLPVLLIVLALLLAGITMAQDMNYQQSPLLDEAVNNGELPPVGERLPANPVVLVPFEEIGTYGGTFRRGTAALITYMTHNLTREPLMMWNVPVTGDGPIQANLAESWESNEDKTEWTVNLREGVQWSDGEPFTAEDVAFYWFDIALNGNVTNISGVNTLLLNNVAPELEIIDDFTIKYTYPEPFPAFAEAHASLPEIAWPKHYLAQFHPDYTDGATYEQLNIESLLENGRGRVTLQAWMLDDYVPGEHYNLVRNPYYWKVDPEGNQLPYFDYVTVELVEDRQAVALGNVTGRFDMDAVWVGVQHLQLFSEAIQDGRDVSLTFADFAGVGFYFNLDIEDETKRAAFRNPNFRRAFSMALNRQEIGDLFYSGLFEPAGSVFAPQSGYYREEDAAKWSAYDPEAARELLEAEGYVDTDGDGFRESPDGEPLELVIDVGVHDLYTPVVELVTEYLADVGIRAAMNAQDQTLIRDLFQAGDFEIHAWDIDGLDYPTGGTREFLAPAGPNTPAFHLNWESDPESEEFLRYAQLMTDALTVVDEERAAMLTEASSLLSDNVWFVATGFWTRPFIKSNRLGNAPDYISRNGQVHSEAPFQPPTLFELYAPGEGGS